MNHPTQDSALPSLLLVGGGRMGAAMLTGWLEQGLAPSIVVDPSPQAQSLTHDRVQVVATPEDVPTDYRPSCVILAVKPQLAQDVVPAYVAFNTPDTVFLSIMAGRTLTGLSTLVGPQAAIIRAMPNTPAAIRQGMTVACANPHVRPGQRNLCDRLLKTVGDVAWVEDEALLDPVTAVSGSGPAYVFLLAELLEQSALTQGIPAPLARLLARRTVAGAGALLNTDPADAAELRRAVTSPKGTTEQALQVLMRADSWPERMEEAVAAATQRARELANG